MLKKKLLIKKPLVEMSKTRMALKPKIEPIKVKPENVSAFVARFDKPNIEEAIQIFKKYSTRCCANKLAHMRTKDQKLLNERSRSAKKELFEALLKAGIARHFSWKEEN